MNIKAQIARLKAKQKQSLSQHGYNLQKKSNRLRLASEEITYNLALHSKYDSMEAIKRAPIKKKVK